MTADVPPAKSSSTVLPFLVFSALLLAFLIPVVIWRKPIVTEDERRGWIGHHQEPDNAILARRLIRSQLTAPPTRWSHDTFTWEIGRGIWCARGAVGIASPEGKEIATQYEVLFIPGDTAPLYDKIGSHTEGDRASALQQAGVKSETP